MKNVVVAGGANGTGLVVRGLKQYSSELKIDAVISMSDSGRSGALLRDLWNVPGMADVWRVLLALSTHEAQYQYLIEQTYKKRFSSTSKFAGINIGCALLGLGYKFSGDLIAIIRDLENMFDCAGSVHPATLDMTDLRVQLRSGEEIIGEGNIDSPEKVYDAVIERAWLDRPGTLHSNAREVIENADVMIMGPGDLYTSTIASLLADGTKEAIAASKATLIYVAGNKYTIGGEPAPKRLSERVAALEQYLPRPIDLVIYDSHELSDKEKEHYKEKDWGLLTFDQDAMSGKKVIGVDIEKDGGGISYEKLGTALKTHL